MTDQQTPRTNPILRVTVRDLELGEERTGEVQSGDYVILTTDPAYVAGIQRHANGTAVITVKGLIR